MKILKNANKCTIRERVLAALRSDLESGFFSEGQILKVSELACRFRASRTPVRESLLSLVDEGFLKVRHRMGFEVRSLDVDELLSIYNLRFILEAESIKLAARKITDKQIADLENLLITDIDRNVAKCNREFHTAIAVVSGSKILAEMIENLLRRGHRVSLLDSHILRPRDLGVESHSEIVSALKSRDETLAVSIMNLHIAQARSRILLTLSENENMNLQRGQI